MKDPLENYLVYRKALVFHDHVIKDTQMLMRGIRGREIAKQLVGSCGSISADFQEGYGRESSKEFAYFLRIARGSARESQGWYGRSRGSLPDELIRRRLREADEVTALLVSTIASVRRG